MTDNKISFEQQLEKLKRDYAAQLPSKVEDIVADWNKLSNRWQFELIVKLHRNVHTLIGTSGTFGFAELSKSARELEQLLKPLLEKPLDYLPDAELCSHVHAAINKLFILIEQLSSDSRFQYFKNFAHIPVTANLSGTVTADVLIYYLDDELAGPSLLIQNLMSYGFTSRHYRTMAQLMEAIHHTKPSLVMIDLIMPDINEPDVFIKAKEIFNMDIPVFVLSGRDNFFSRLASVRAGAKAYITKPADIPALVGLIRNTLHLNINKPPHILIVDDHVPVAEFYANVLTHAGMRVTIEENPANCLRVMESHAPDLLLLDLNMPDISGDELAAVIRQQEKYQSIPILFLSAEAHPERKTHLIEIGSDDLLSKDMPPTELVRQVKSRVERAQMLTSMMYQDSLTGLLNHAQIQLAAARVFSNCQRKKSNCIIAMIDIDKFKMVNDTYGHLTGDRVIKALAQLLLQRLRLTDYIGRFGGEEFMLVLPDINSNEAGTLINDLRKAFFAIDFIDGETTFNVSFSAGISENTGTAHFIEQIKCADEALYRAKKRGRNIVCVSVEST